MYGKWREPQYAQSYLGKVYKTVSFIRYKLYPNIAKVFGQVHQVIYDFFQKRMSTEMWITHHIPKKYALHHFSLLVCTTNFVGWISSDEIINLGFWDILGPYFLVPEASEMDYEEMPTYSGMKLFSDIGGAACLGMGVSMASIVGIFEYIIYK